MPRSRSNRFLSCYNSCKESLFHQWQHHVLDSTFMRKIQKKRPLLEPSITQYGLWTKGYLDFPECENDAVNLHSSIYDDEILSTTDDEGEVREKLIGKMKVSADLLDAIFLQKTQSALVLEKNYCFKQSQTDIFISLVPDIAVHAKKLSKESRERFAGVLLFMDVSGFSSLCESFSANAKDGIYMFTSILNNYLGSLVDTILSYNGDVFKFSGDALLAVWKVTGKDYMMYVVHNALMCAMYIQINFGSYIADKVTLRVKAAISAGSVTFCVIGNEFSKRCILVGSPVDEVKNADRVWSSGDVILTPSAWRYCSERNYQYVYKDDKHVKILRIIYDPRDVKLKLFDFSSYNNSPGVRGVQEKELECAETNKIEEYFNESSVQQSSTYKSSFKRRSMGKGDSKLGVSLRPFIAYPVSQQVEAFQPLEYLTEMRKITTMFVNIIPKEKITSENLISGVDEAYCIISQEVYLHLGILIQVFLFDKDIMYLVTFGLRGSQHETEISRCLRCAYNVRNKIKDKEFVKHISIGVTNGMVYSGVVGHQTRKDYTVIGGSVNKAARFMCTYLDKVTCDYITFKNSNLPTDCFILQETRTLKGITDVGEVYEYTEEKKSVPETIQVPILLNRERELKMFENMIKKTGEKNNIIISGDRRSGKSHLLKGFVKVGAHYNYNCVLVSQADFNVSMAYFTIQQVFKNVLGPEKWNKRESYVEEILRPSIPSTDLFNVNDVLQTKFQEPASKGQINKKFEKMRDILTTLINLEFTHVVVIVDEGHYVDEQSKALLNIFSRCSHIIFIVSVCKDEKVIEEFFSIMDPRVTRRYHLENLENKYLDPLVTQFLGVTAIDRELSIVLELRSHGNPGWCHNYIQYLVESGTLVFEEIKWKDAVADPKVIIPDVNKYCIHQFRTPTKVYKGDDTVLVCKVTGDASLISRVNMPPSLEGLIMTAFDSLTPHEQMLLKCSAVMGHNFPRLMLESVINFYRDQFAETIQSMFEKRILKCAKDISKDDTSQPLKDRIRDKPVCLCVIEDSLFKDTGSFPKYAYCQHIKFTLGLFRDITYELLPFNQRKEFHERAISYLQKQEHICTSCERSSNTLESTLSEYTTIVRKSLHEEKKRGMGLNTQFLLLGYLTGDPSDKILAPFHRMINFTSCQCANITIKILRNLIYHAEGADCAKIEMFNGMSLSALSKLQKSLKVLQKYAESDELPGETEVNLLRAEIHILTGQAYYHCQHIKKAELELTRGLLILSMKFRRLKYACFKYLPKRLWSEPSNKPMVLEVLGHSLLASVSMETGKWSAASLSAKRALSVILLGDFELTEVCMAYQSSLDVASHMLKKHLLPALERDAVNACFKADLLTVKQAIHLGIVSSSLFLSSMMAGQLSKAAKTAVVTIEIAIRVKADLVKSIFLFFLTQIMLLQTHLVDAVNALEDFNKTNAGLYKKHIMFYLLCFTLLLEAGICYTNPEDCIAQCQQSSEFQKTNTYVSRLHLLICQWLLRMDRIEEAGSWFQKVPDMQVITLSNFRTLIIYIECCLLCYVKLKREDLKDVSCNICVSLPAIYKRMKELKQYVKNYSADLLPRILFNMAYYYRIQNKRYQSILDKALQICLKQENYLYKNIIEENMTYWENPKKWKPNNWDTLYKNGNYVTNKEMLLYGWSDLLYCFPVPE